MKLVALYARVSTANQEEEETIKAQILADKELIQKCDFRLVKEYTDEGWSGDILARPALDRLRQEAKEKMWQVLVVYDPDRLARRYSYQELIMDELREAGIEVVFVTVSAPKNNEDKILYGVRGLFAEYERAKIAERFRMGKLRKVKEGHILISEPLYGYRYIPKTDKAQGYLEINEEEARVVRMIFDWVDREHLTIRMVIRRLHEAGIKPRKSTRGVWSTSTLSTLLRHKSYIGEAHWGSSYAVVPEAPINKDKYRKVKKSSRRKKPEDEWYKIPVPAIIDRELFERVRARIESNFLLCHRKTVNQYLLAGKIRCVCGKRRGGEGPKHGKHLYYRCNDRVSAFPLPPTCGEKAVNAKIADRLVWREVTKLMSSPDLMRMQISCWMNSQRKKIATVGSDTHFLRAESAKLREQEDRYNKAYGAGAFTIEKLKEYTAPVREKITLYESQILTAERQERERQSIPVPDESAIKLFAKKASEDLYHLEFKAKKAIVTNVVDRVVGTREKLEVYGFIPITNNNMSRSVLSIGADNTRLDLTAKEGTTFIPFHLKINMPPAWPIGPAK